MDNRAANDGWFYGRRRLLPILGTFVLVDCYLVFVAGSLLRTLWALAALALVVGLTWRCWVNPLPAGYEERRAKARLEQSEFGRNVWHKVAIAILAALGVLIVAGGVVNAFS
jgi:hypothetical protein